MQPRLDGPGQVNAGRSLLQGILQLNNAPVIQAVTCARNAGTDTLELMGICEQPLGSSEHWESKKAEVTATVRCGFSLQVPCRSKYAKTFRMSQPVPHSFLAQLPLQTAGFFCLFVLLLLLYCFNTACGSISLASTDCVNSLERLWKLPRKTAWEQHSRSSWEAVSCLPALASFPQSTPNHKPVQFCMVSEEASWPWGQLHVGLRELNHASWSLHGVITVKSSTRSNVESGCFGAFITYATTNDSFMVKCTWIEG